MLESGTLAEEDRTMAECSIIETLGDRSRVALVRCESYDPSQVMEAVGRGIDLLGGADRFARPGERILLKPNFLVSSAPTSAVTTHPSVFGAVARSLKAAGAELSYGDSPGFGSASAVARKSGVAQAAQEEGVTLADFTSGRTVSFPDGRLIKQFTVAESVLDADGLVSLPKLKSHALTRMTGAIKNQLGCVPGMLKSEWHARMPDVVRFSQMLVDLNRLLTPRLFVMDGIVAMEGNGPRSGDPRQMSVLLFSEDPVAIDAAACRLIGLDIALVDTVTFGEEWGLGSASDIECLGDPIDSFVTEDFVVDRSRASTTGGPGLVSRLMKDWVVPRPVIVSERCSGCATCVTVCPVEPKAVDFASQEARREKDTPLHDYDRCIRCYCCQEMCPEHAIEVHTPVLGRLMHRR